MILLDTHAWIWHLADRSSLSKSARAAIDAGYRSYRTGNGGTVAISAISIWELFTLVKKGRLDLNVPPASFLTNTRRDSAMKIVPVDEDIARRSVELPDIHQDPADRFILATAVEMGWPVISRDTQFSGYDAATVIW